MGKNKFRLAKCVLVGIMSVVTVNNAWAQICHADAGTTTPNRAFIDHGNGTISHQSTGLMWKKCLEGQRSVKCFGVAAAMPWDSAREQADSASNQHFAGYADWRLPTRKELASIVERQCENPAANLQLFPQTPSAGLWSSEDDGMNAWGVDFSRGAAYRSFKGGGKYVRLVRSLR